MNSRENLLPDRYQILGELGRGGTSVVFHARDSELEREVAVKVLLEGTQEDRFKKEAERLSSLSHPNVVSFLEVGQHEGHDYLVMEYLEMGDLSSFVRGLGIGEIIELFCQVCDGLAHLHDKGIVHRDIKPANILVNREGCPKVADLGVARQVEANTKMTQAGTILGTYSYLAPEQIVTSDVTASADLYSLGICLFIALTGRKPFEADNEFNMLRAHLEEKPPSIKEFLPQAPESLAELVSKMLAKEPKDRPRSARMVIDYLQTSLRELKDAGTEETQPAWNDMIEELSEDHRSVLLAVTYLGSEATFERVCAVSPFSEDKTDLCLEGLLQDNLITSPTEDSFSLNCPEETVSSRLTPRLKKLFANRLGTMASSAELAAVVSEDSPTPTPTPREAQTAVASTTAPIAEEPVEPKPTPEPVIESPKVVTVEEKALEAASKKSGSRWPLMAALFLFLGVALAIGGQYYYNHSAALYLTSQPEGAKVTVDGLDKGVTPIEVSALKPGTHAVSVSLDGFKQRSESVELGFQQHQEEHYALVPQVGHLHLTVVPKDAHVKIGDKDYGQVLSELELSAREHTLVISKKGFETNKVELEVIADKTVEKEVVLEPVAAQVKIDTQPEKAVVYLDGVKVGKSPVKLAKVAYGSHKLKVVKKGHETYHHKFEVKTSEDLRITRKLKRVWCVLEVTSKPSEATLKVNGKIVGKTPKSLSELDPGEVTVIVNKDGYNAATKVVKIAPGSTKSLDFALDKIVVAPPPVYRPPPPTYRPPPRTPPPTYRPPPPTYRPPPRTPPPTSNPWDVK